jgi:hypothetical protein
MLVRTPSATSPDGRDADPQSWITQGQQAKRRAAEVAIAIDGLADRAALALSLTPDEVRTQVSQRCILGTAHRAVCIDRVCAVANAYKHAGPLRAKHPMRPNRTSWRGVPVTTRVRRCATRR